VRLVRRKGRVVVVGDVGLAIERTPFYLKEAELRISCSCGPGRYDPSYEEGGRDYPFPYVRWTENRNMEEFLRLAGAGCVRLGDLRDAVHPVDDAPGAYAALSEDRAGRRPLAVLLSYGDPQVDDPAVNAARRVEIVRRTRPAGGVAVALVGPGAFARAIHLPNLEALAPAATLRAVVGRTPAQAREAARRFGAAYATTDLGEALADEQVELVLICTRHDLHADQAARALDAGKAVFLEKPAAIDLAGLDRLGAAVVRAGRPFAVGFNRRCAPAIERLRPILAARRGPVVIDYRVNAARLAADHWTLGPAGGGRLVGEACHMIDLLGSLVGRPRETHALQVLLPPAGRGDLRLGDNLILGIRYADGSLATLVYTSLGDAGAGKERIECHWDGCTAVVDDFRSVEVEGARGSARRLERPDKGHAELLRRFVEHVAGHAPAPIPWEEILDTSRFVLELEREARGSRTRAASEGASSVPSV
jgi:predicted dehydrogenase